MNKFVRNALKIGFSNAFSKIIGIIASPLITRLYTPSNFGELGIFLSFVSLIQPFLGGKYENAIIVSESQKEAYSLYHLSLLISLLITICVIKATLVYYYFFNNYFECSNLFLLCLPATLMVTGYAQANRSLLNYKENYTNIARSTFISGFTTTIIKIVLGWIKIFQSIGLIAAEFWTKFSYVVLTYHSTSVSLKGLTWSRIKQVAVVYSKFPLVEIPVGFIVSLTSRAAVFLLAYIFGDVTLGLYIFCEQMLRKFVDLATNSLGEVYYRTATNLDLIKIRQLTLSLIKRLILIGSIPFTLLLFHGDFIFSFLFGAEWERSGLFSKLITPYLFLVFIYKPMQSLFRILKKQEIQFYVSLFQLILIVISIYVGGKIFNNDPIRN